MKTQIFWGFFLQSKSILMKRVSYSIQFEAGTKTVKSLKIIKISQASEQIVIDVSGSGEHEKKNRKYNDEAVDLEYRNSSHMLTWENLPQMTIFEKMVEFDVFYRDPK